MREKLFAFLETGCPTRDLILKGLLANASDEVIEFALTVAEAGHSEVYIFIALGS